MTNIVDSNQDEMGKDVWDRLWSRSIINTGLKKLFPKFNLQVRNYYRFKINKLLKGTNLNKAHILELGCGSGINSINLLKDHACEKAVLVDFSQQAIEIAKDYTKNYRVEIIHADIFNLDLKKKFDFVFSIGLIEHFVEDRRNEAVKILRQITKNDGLIMIIVPKKTFFSYILKFFNQVQGYQEEFFSDQEIEGLFKKNGLDIVKKSEMLFGIASCYLLRCQVGLKSSVNC